MSKIGNASQYRELEDSELDSVSGGEGNIKGFLDAAVAAGMPLNTIIDVVNAIFLPNLQNAAKT